MNNIKRIRRKLKLTQLELGDIMGCTQGNVSFMERGQVVPPDAAAKLIEFGKSQSVEVSFDDIYGPEREEEPAAGAPPAANDAQTVEPDSIKLLSPQHAAPYRGPNRRQQDNPPDPDLERREAAAAALAVKTAKGSKKSPRKTT